MKKLVALFLGLCPVAGYAQASPTATRPDSAIHLDVVPNGRYSRVFYTINQKSLTTATVVRLLKRYPPAAEELRQDRAQRRLVLLGLLPACAAGLVVGGLQANQEKNVPGSSFSKAPVPFSIGLAAMAGMFCVGVTNHHFEKAIEVYNKQFH